MHPTQVSRILRNFRAHRLYAEVPEPFDHRIKRLHVTPRGAILKTAIDRASDRAVREILRRVPMRDRRALVTALETVARLIGPATSAARSTPASA
jgi:DNA-binding MarR family transcriptional regulator